MVTAMPGGPATITRQRKMDPTQIQKQEKQAKGAHSFPVHWVDYVSRLLFPFSYFTFLTHYWMTNMNAGEIQLPT